jgi:neutral trehalase
VLYDKETGVYMDRHIKTGKFTGLCSVGSFMPLYAGLTPKPLARRMCQDYLLNPGRFYTTLPFPTVDSQHQIFRSGGYLFEPAGYPGALSQHAYWNGRAWPQFNYWMVGAIHRSGLESQADEAADRILRNYDTQESLHECYDPLTGFGNGHPEFLWSAAAALGLIFQLYKKPPVPELSLA